MTTRESLQGKIPEAPTQQGAYEVISPEQASQAFEAMAPFTFNDNAEVAKLSGEKRPVQVAMSQEQLSENDYYLAIHGKYGDSEVPISFMHLNPIVGQVAELGRPVSVGRAADSDFRFNDALVSAKHAEISYDPEKGGQLSAASTNESYLFIVPKTGSERSADADIETIPRSELKKELGKEALQAEIVDDEQLGEVVEDKIDQERIKAVELQISMISYQIDSAVRGGDLNMLGMCLNNLSNMIVEYRGVDPESKKIQTLDNALVAMRGYWSNDMTNNDTPNIALYEPALMTLQQLTR